MGDSLARGDPRRNSLLPPWPQHKAALQQGSADQEGDRKRDQKRGDQRVQAHCNPGKHAGHRKRFTGRWRAFGKRCALTAAVCDIVYNPLETDLLKRARARGHRTVDGLGMLMHQAVPSFAEMFGVTPRVTPALRALLERALHG